MSEDQKGIDVGRRDFIKTSAMAVIGTTLSSGSAYAEETGNMAKSESSSVGNKIRNKKLLCLSGFPEKDNKLIESIESNRELDFHVKMHQFDIREPFGIAHGQDFRFTPVIMGSQNVVLTTDAPPGLIEFLMNE